MSAPPDPPGRSVPDEIGPCQTRSPVVPLLTLVPVGFLIWLGVDLWRLIGWSEPSVLAVIAGLCAVFTGLSAVMWFGQPFVTAHVVFHEDGVEVAQSGRLTRRVGPIRLRWDEVVGLRHLSLRAQQSQLGLELSDAGMIAHGRAQPTLREGGPRWMAPGTIWLSLPGLGLPADQVIDAFLAQASAAGCDVTYRGGEYGVATNRLWDVRAPEGAR